jgi:hypothetical protein
MAVVDILRGIAFHAVLPPVQIVERPQNGYRYQLGNDTHRFYASVVAGFSHVPTVPGWIPDREALPTLNLIDKHVGGRLRMRLGPWRPRACSVPEVGHAPGSDHP